MRKLLSANFSRLWKDKIFWICLIATLLVSAGSMLNGCRQAFLIHQEGYTRGLDDYYFMLAPLLVLLPAIFVSMFLGTEYSDGTIRNKLVVGQARIHIYLANYIVCFAAGLLFLAAWLAGGLIGLPILGTWKLGAKGVLLFVLTAVFFLAALTGIFTLLSMLSTNKAVTAVTAIILAFGLLVLASVMYNKLCEPEMISGIVMTGNGMEMGEPSPNPLYVSGTARAIMEWLLNALPTGQAILMANLEITHPLQNIFCSVCIAIGTTACGIVAFYRKDLK